MEITGSEAGPKSASKGTGTLVGGAPMWLKPSHSQNRSNSSSNERQQLY